MVHVHQRGSENAILGRSAVVGLGGFGGWGYLIGRFIFRASLVLRERALRRKLEVVELSAKRARPTLSLDLLSRATLVCGITFVISIQVLAPTIPVSNRICPSHVLQVWQLDFVVEPCAIQLTV